ncbi:dihydrolipoamide dehydrogenase [Erysipelothrix larvae]|uniref:Dihydrolipoyl dehydrogenase n=1 Tax=Erysipelothrix larvae TaxID=1514105 RepID=A0A0X8GZ52_9FIRM|nr:dihydrolipoyl dehydrogenase [Erysipelothrix larvae]AMC93102.1 dihydrolipoamide dehydrogenase [Erysipelothrix larvae]
MVVGDFAKQTGCLIIGSGPGGYVAAIRASQLGQQVTIVEKDAIGGTCLNVGCIPSKALIQVATDYEKATHSNPYGLKIDGVSLDFKVAQNWKKNEVVRTLTQGIKMLLKKNNVEIVYGSAHFIDNHRVRVMGDEINQTYQFESCIIASGSRPLELPSFKYNESVLDSTRALNLTSIPKSLIIIGGGYIGCELACIYSKLGTHITILEGTAHILPNFSKDLVKYVETALEHKGANIVTHVFAKGVESTQEGCIVSFEKDGHLKKITAEKVLVTIGRQPNTDTIGLEYTDVKVDAKGLIEVDDQGRTSVHHIFAIGDVTFGPQLAHKATYEAKVVASVINGHPGGFDNLVIPKVCYTTPEIAGVGYTLEEATQNGIHAKTAQFPYHANGRSLTMNQTEGFIRIIYNQETLALLGAEIVGAHASELIAELTMALETHLTLEDVALIIHAHPTLSEMIDDAAQIGLGHPIHSVKGV